MKQDNLIYLDQNLLQYDFEDRINIPNKSGIQWVYSDEHFNEINRKLDKRFFEVLERLKARKIKVRLDNKYRLTNECVLLEYSSPKSLFDEYLETISDYKAASTLFLPLQTFFFGNTNSLDPNAYTSHFEEVISNLTKDLLEDIDVPKSELDLRNYIGSVSNELKNTINSARPQITPLNEMRKQITKKQFSDLKVEDGIIIDQIWKEIGSKLSSLTKDQFFGKEVSPFSTQNDSTKEQILFLGIVQCHTVLNFLGYWPDEGLPKESKLFGINSDASHIAHSFFCSGIISADDRLCKKARAIYEYFGKANTVFQIKF